MRKMIGASLLLVCFCLTAQADISIKGSTTVQPYKFVELTIDGAADKAQCIWKVSGTDANGKTVTPDVRKKGLKIIFVGPPGSYAVEATVVDFDSKTINQADVTVTIGDPVPPGPPPPADPFMTTLQSVWTQETASDRCASAAQLAALYSTAGGTTINDTTLLTVGDFFTKWKAAVASLLPTTAIPKVRAAIGTNLDGVLPKDPKQALDATTRSIIAREFTRIAADMNYLSRCK